jgi:hypothetical protein
MQGFRWVLRGGGGLTGKAEAGTGRGKGKSKGKGETQIPSGDDKHG